jgi:hypothetical protein
LRNFPGICPADILEAASMNSFMKVLRFDNLNTENSRFITKLRNELTQGLQHLRRFSLSPVTDNVLLDELRQAYPSG